MKKVILVSLMFSLLSACGSDEEPTPVYQFKSLSALCDEPCKQQLWTLDNQGNVHQVSSFTVNEGVGQPYLFQDKYYFSADDGIHGREIWLLDQIHAQPRLLLDLNDEIIIETIDNEEVPVNQSSYPGNFFEYQNHLYFSANKGENVGALWKTDGTAQGTQLVFDPRSDSATASASVANLVELNGQLLFTAYGENAAGQHVGKEWWSTNGTHEGTQLITELIAGSEGGGIGNIFKWNNKLYFQGTDGNDTANNPNHHSYSLFVTDGTAQGTELVKDINATEVAFSEARIRYMTDLGDRFIFRAHDGIHGTEMWVSDGSEAGTQLLLDATEGETSSEIRSVRSKDNLGYFITRGNGLSAFWKTDGTVEGTERIRYFDYAVDLEVVDVGIILSARHGDEQGLWLSDGSSEGTHLYYQSEDIGWLNSPLNPLVYFYKDPDKDEQAQGITVPTLWYTDGSAAGTRQAQDAQNRVLFNAED